MMKRNLFFILTLFAITGLFAQEQIPRIAVFPFEILDNAITQNEAVMLYQQFSNEFTNMNTGRFDVVPRLDVERLINTEAQFQLSIFSAQEKTAEMERVLNGTQILSGRIGRVGNDISIIVSLYTYPDLRQLSGGASVTGRNFVELFSKTSELVQDMQKYIAGGSASGTGNIPMEKSVRASEFLQYLAEIKLADSGNYTITLTEDVFLTYGIRFSGFEGKTITIQGDSQNRMITSNLVLEAFFQIPRGVTLILGNNITLNGNKNVRSSVQVVEGGRFNMRNGAAISDNTVTGVFVLDRNSTFTMSGGTISGNTGNYGAGVEISNGGIFIMSGGIISGNTAEQGGGVSIWQSTFTMSGGIINGNTAEQGGGVSIWQSTFTMSGGTISGNSAVRGGGGGVFVEHGSVFTLNDGIIRGNGSVYSGGGVLVSDSTLNMNGGTISGNTAKNGGGVWFSQALNVNTFTMNGGTINGNIVSDLGGGVAIAGGSFIMNGGVISGNTAEEGGGVWFHLQQFESMAYLNAKYSKRGGTIDGTNNARRGKVVQGGAYDYIFLIRNSAAGPSVNMDSSISGRAGGWE